MNTSKSIPGSVLIFGVFITLMMMSATLNAADTDQAHIISIYGGDSYSVQSVRLDPEELLIKKGSVVIWNNWAKTTEVKVIFKEGKKVCPAATSAPVGFNLDDAKQCYVTSWVPLGGTSSLRFTQAGTFKYTVQTTGGVEATGRIVVE